MVARLTPYSRAKSVGLVPFLCRSLSSAIVSLDNVGFLPTFLYFPAAWAIATPSLTRFTIKLRSNSYTLPNNPQSNQPYENLRRRGPCRMQNNAGDAEKGRLWQKASRCVLSDWRLCRTFFRWIKCLLKRADGSKNDIWFFCRHLFNGADCNHIIFYLEF